VEPPDKEYEKEDERGDKKHKDGKHKIQEKEEEELVEEGVERDYCDIPFCDEQGKYEFLIEVNVRFNEAKC
jgi:hypothetical protein